MKAIEEYWTVLFCGAVYYVLQNVSSNFCISAFLLRFLVNLLCLLDFLLPGQITPKFVVRL